MIANKIKHLHKIGKLIRKAIKIIVSPIESIGETASVDAGFFATLVRIQDARPRVCSTQLNLFGKDENYCPASGGGNYPNIIGDKVYYAVNMWVGCYELMTGKRLWFLRVTPSSLFSDMIVAEGKLLANGQNAKLYAIDPETGSVPWVQRSSGFSSALHYQDGVVYYIETKLLIATRVSDGKVLWALECPDAYTENRTDSWITGFVTGVPGKNGRKGRIFVSTNLNVYCFEAAQ